MNQQRWAHLMTALGLAPNEATGAALIAAYSESHRHYHTTEHVSACLQHLDAARDLADRPAEVELALWFHDAVYKPFSKTNERDSADWALRFLEENGASPEMQNRIDGLIMITAAHEAPASVDEALMLDIDLSILGAPAAVYDVYEKNIRKEYRLVPGMIFRPNRRAILASFLDREHVFYTDYCRERWEENARANLTRAIKALQ